MKLLVNRLLLTDGVTLHIKALNTKIDETYNWNKAW